MLSNKNIASDYAGNGEDAIKMIASGAGYDLLLIDYHMPDMDGFKSLQKIRKLNVTGIANVPVILLNRSSEEDILVNDNEDNHIYRLVKPVKIKQLFNTISEIFDGNKQGAGLEGERREIFDYNDILTSQFTVLVVEDHLINMLLVKTMLKKVAPGVIIIEAVNGAKAVEQFLKEKPDLVLMDVQMPEMNGYEATMQIRKNESGERVPIIALTAGTVKGEREKCLEAGMDDYLTKPILKDTLEKALEKWLIRRI